MDSISRHRFKELNNLSLTLQLAGYSSEILYWGYIEPNYWRNYRHVHSFFEVCYAFQGVGHFRLGAESIDVRQGDLFIARPNEPHDILSSHEDPLGIYFWAYTLIPVGVVKKERSMIQEPLHALFSGFAQSKIRRVGASASLTQTIDLLTREIIGQESGYSLTIRGLATNLLVETARMGCGKTVLTAEAWPQGASRADSAFVLQIKRYLQDNYMRPVRLREIAAQVHLSERHICRLFGEQTGHSIQQYLANIRIDIAKQMLLDQTNSVASVALATGFSEPRYFATFFRQATGETPTQFRQRNGTAFLDES